MEHGEDREEFCLQILVILVEACPGNVDFLFFCFKCSTHFVRNRSFVLALMVLWKLNLEACKDVA